MKRIVWFLLIILGLTIVIGGCARWPDGPEPGPDEPEYQLKITVEVKGEINIDEGMYYIVFDTDENPANGPGENISFWDDRFYYIKLDNWGFHFAQVKDDFESIFDGGSFSENKLQATIALSDLENPTSIDINVLTTDSNNNTYDSLNSYFTMSTGFGSTETRSDSQDDSGDGGADLDITNVTAEITTL